MNQRSSDFFTCGHCGNMLQKGCSGAEAIKEHALVFGYVPPPEEQVIICDDCWVKIITWVKAIGLLPDNSGAVRRHGRLAPQPSELVEDDV